jgi:MFS family permease
VDIAGTCGIMLLLPITMSVMGVSLLTAVVPSMLEQCKDVPNGAYSVQLLLTMPAIWILLFSPLAGWLADTYARPQYPHRVDVHPRLVVRLAVGRGADAQPAGT